MYQPDWLDVTLILLLLALHTTSSAFAPPPPPPPHDSRRISRFILSYQNNGRGIQHIITQQYPHQTRPSTQLKSADAPFYVGRNLAVAGRIPWKKLLINKSQAKEILSIMRAETHTLDVVMIVIYSLFPEKIGKLF